jgi:hypothetical protein
MNSGACAILVTRSQGLMNSIRSSVATDWMNRPQAGSIRVLPGEAIKPTRTPHQRATQPRPCRA